MNAFTSLEWKDELPSGQSLWRSNSPDYGELEVIVPAKFEGPFAWLV